MFLLISRIKLCIYIFSEEAILFPVYTYVPLWLETRLTENGISPEPKLCTVSFICKIEAYIHPSLFVKAPNQFDSFFYPKNGSEYNSKILLRRLLVNLKNVWVLAPPMLFSIELWRYSQPLVFPSIQASNGAVRSVKHDRRDVVILIRGYRMTKRQEQLYRIQTHQGVLLSDLLLVRKILG